jgi:hypothetical protein
MKRTRDEEDRPNKGLGASSLNDFYLLDDDEFVDAAYQVVLQRKPDPEGAAFYLDLLLRGASRIEVLGRLRFSPEGSSVGMRIKGLATAYLSDRFARTAVCGRLFAFLLAPWILVAEQRRSRILQGAIARRAKQTDENTRDVQQTFRQTFFNEVDNLKSELSKLLSRASELATNKLERDHLIPVMHEIRAIREGAAGLETALFSEIDNLKSELSKLLSRASELATNKLERGHLISVMHEIQAIREGSAGLETALSELRGGKADLEQLRHLHEDLVADTNEWRSSIQETLADRTGRREMQALLKEVENLKFDVSKLKAEKVDLEHVRQLKDDLIMELANRSKTEDLRDLRGRLNSLDSAIENLSQHKLNRVALEQVERELRTTVHRAVDDVNRTFRMLLDSKGDKDAIAGALCELEATARANLGAIMNTIQAIEERKAEASEVEAQLLTKADATAIETVKKEIQATLRTGVEGLTHLISAVSQNKVDRITVNSIVAEAVEMVTSTAKTGRLPVLRGAEAVKSDLIRKGSRERKRPSRK